VVVVSLEGGDALEATLGALRQQDPCVGGVEVIVVGMPTQTIVARAGLEGGFRLLPSSNAASPAVARARAVAEARAPLIALTEDHCVPAGDWCARIVAAHRESHAAIGGAIAKRTPAESLGWAIYFADYSRYMPQMRAGEAPYLSDCNVSYKREALDEVRDVWREAFHETAVHAALLARGASLWLDPSILVYEDRHLPLRALLSDRYDHGRLFAALRSAELSAGKRLALSILAWGLPVLSVGRIAMRTILRRGAVGRLLASLPSLVMITAAWAAGESAGYATGRQKQ
jgi:hypothetical protein